MVREPVRDSSMVASATSAAETGTAQVTHISSAFYFPLTLVNVVRFAIQGMGFSMFAILAGVCEMIARSFCGFVLVPMFGFAPVCFGNPAAWIAADLFLVPAFWHCYKKLKIKFDE